MAWTVRRIIDSANVPDNGAICETQALLLDRLIYQDNTDIS